MLISMNWIKDFVDLSGIETEELIKRFVLSTAEIERVEYKGQNVKGLIFAKINKVEPHPNSTKLHILEVFDGKQNLQVVCGAPNVKPGMITVFAPIGAVLPEMKISKAKIAGVESFGMCCGETEIGIGSDDSGIIEILDDVKIGQDIKEVFPIDDIVFEIDNKSLTNRPDLWGHYGIAREFAAIFSRELKPLELVDLSAYSHLPKPTVVVEDNNCYRYSAITVENVTKKVSDYKTKIRLNYCGMNDINFLADLTNYLMLELGQPMHAFDNSIVKDILVKKADKDTKILTLDDQEYLVPQDSCLICKLNGEPIAIAGVKGGKLSGITEKTNSLFLESACFDATSIRKTSTKVGLKTDAALRYEKSLDPNLTPIAVARLLKILLTQNPEAVVTSSLADVQTFEYPKVKINITKDFIEKRIGVEISNEQIVKILTSLEFKVKENNNEFEVEIPSYRATKDISIKEDLIEEISRMYGYDNIVPKSIEMEVQPAIQQESYLNEFKTKYLLAQKYNFSEVHSHIWNYADFNKEHEIESPSYVWLEDSSNSGQAGIRSELIPTLLRFFEENKNSFEDINIFEIGRVVTGLDQNNMAIEEKHLAIVSASQTKTNEQLYFGLKSFLMDLANNVLQKEIQVDFANENELPNYFHITNSAKILIDNKKIGLFGLLHPQNLLAIDKRFKVAILELDFNLLCKLGQKTKEKFVPVSKFQSVSLDLNFKVPTTFKYQQVENFIKNYKTKLNMTFKLIDIYKDPKQPDCEFWTFNFNIVANDRTLTSEEIEKFSNKLIDHMSQNGIVLKNE